MIDKRTIFESHRLAHEGLSVRKIAKTLGLAILGYVAFVVLVYLLVGWLAGLSGWLEGLAQFGSVLFAMFIAWFIFPSAAAAIAGIFADEVIDAVEETPRGVYAGAFGWIAPDGRADLAVVIRSLTTAGDGTWTLGTGGGITVQSDVAEEYAEATWKAERLLGALASPAESPL